MNPYGQEPPVSVDAYLARLRSALGSMPGNEADEVLREFRGHILDRLESAAPSDNQPLIQILSELGSPEAIGTQYRTDALVARARATFSPVLIFRTTIRLAMKTAVGFVAFLLGIVGYGVGIPLIACAVLKPVFPRHIGLWVHPRGIELATPNPNGLGPELLGWWVIPISLLLGTLTVIGTTIFLRWMLRFASRSMRGISASA